MPRYYESMHFCIPNSFVQYKHARLNRYRTYVKRGTLAAAPQVREMRGSIASGKVAGVWVTVLNSRIRWSLPDRRAFL